MSRFTNEDRVCGHKYFDSAIQLSVLAKEKTRISIDSTAKPDWVEAKRLLNAAITDTKFAINEIESDPKWMQDASHWVSHMKEQVAAWEGDVYSMP
jgi:hypothetical protein